MYIYIYQTSDFVSVPDEAGSAASGSPTFTLTLNPGATPILVSISDDDAIFDEIDGSQTIESAITLNGVNYAANTTIHTAYDLSNSGTGHKVTSLHMGGDGFEQGAVHGIVSSIPLVAGQSYTFDQERTSHQQNNSYDDYYGSDVVCFTTGARVRTPGGTVPVEELLVGDLVVTADSGVQAVRWIGRRKLNRATLDASPHLSPILIRKDAFGRGVPRQDMRVSPQHRMLLKSYAVHLYLGEAEAFAPAKSLINDKSIIVDYATDQVEYIHVLFDKHEVIYVDGTKTESFFPGDQAISNIDNAARAELFELFPELRTMGGSYGDTARSVLKPYEVRGLQSIAGSPLLQ